MSEQDPGVLADQLDHQAADLQRRGEEVGQEIDDARHEWQQKRASEAVPGANPPAPEEHEGDRDQHRGQVHSPGPEATPEDEHPSASGTAPEDAPGPPANAPGQEGG